MNLRIPALVLALVTAAATCATAEEVAIVNPATTATTLSAATVREFFLGQKGAWSDGSKVVVVLASDAPDQAPLLHFLGRNQQQFEIGWKKLIFTGRVSTPVQVDSAAAVVERVANTPGAIGYVDKQRLKPGVKEITIQ